MPLVLIILAVGLMIFFYNHNKSDDTVPSANTAINISLKHDISSKKFDNNNPYDICCALA